MIPSNKITNFKSDVKSFYDEMGIKKLKSMVLTNKNKLDSNIHLLDKEPN
jgi:hypothetical protein